MKKSEQLYTSQSNYDYFDRRANEVKYFVLCFCVREDTPIEMKLSAKKIPRNYTINNNF